MLVWCLRRRRTRGNGREGRGQGRKIRKMGPKTRRDEGRRTRRKNRRKEKRRVKMAYLEPKTSHLTLGYAITPPVILTPNRSANDARPRPSHPSPMRRPHSSNPYPSTRPLASSPRLPPPKLCEAGEAYYHPIAKHEASEFEESLSVCTWTRNY